MSMRDVDFLLAALADDPPLLDRTLVYRYRSGVLRPRVLAVLRAAAERRGDRLMTGRLPLAPGFAETGLVGGLMFHDWPARPSLDVGSDAIEFSLDRLAGSLHPPSVHFVPHGGPVGQHLGWGAVERGALVLEEPLITGESLLPVLRYLTAATDLACGADFLAQPLFVQGFEHLIEDRAGLPEIMREFDERVLLCTDPVTHRYDDACRRRDLVRRFGRRTPLAHLRNLAALRQEHDLVDLLDAFDERRAERGWTTVNLATDLYRTAGQLLEQGSDPGKDGSDPRSHVSPDRFEEGALLWAALVLAWEDSISRAIREEADGYRRGPDFLVPALAGLGRDFLARGDREETDDLLAGQWTAVARALRRCSPDGSDDEIDRLSTARGVLVGRLNAALAQTQLRADWIVFLRAQTAAACGWLDTVAHRDVRLGETGTSRPVLSSFPALRPAKTFDELIGRAHAVRGVRRHARERTAGVDLLLYGPDGVGKQTLARVYARAFLCEAPIPDGIACGQCDACQHYDLEARGCIEVDGARPDIESVTDQIVSLVQSGALLSERHVFVISNADRYPPAAFDKLLKPMEDIGAVSFVLLARDRTGVRLAGQSRCFDYHVHTLSQPESEAFLRMVLAEGGLVWDEARIALVVEAGGGLPGRLIDACETVAGMGLASLDTIRTKLDLGWAEDLLELWPTIVADGPAAVADSWPTSDVDRGERVRRVRAALQLLALPRRHDGQQGLDALDPALRRLDERSRAGFAAAIAWRAAQDGTTAEAVWARMAEAWLSDRTVNGRRADRATGRHEHSPPGRGSG